MTSIGQKYILAVNYNIEFPILIAQSKGPGKSMKAKPAFPNGHFYSPIVDVSEIQAHEERLWDADKEVLGIEFDPARHDWILRNWFPRHMGKYRYPERLTESPELSVFYTKNSQFSWLDARALFVFLNEWKPKRFIEVGGGFSSLLTADVNHRFFKDSMTYTCIEPYPRAFLTKPISGLTRLIVERVENLKLGIFESLESGDVLFIDSSHVAKTGSDVTYLMFEVLPRLKPGVHIHIHDIFLPREYPKQWVIGENRSWNEQYVVRALLMYSTAFKVTFGCSFAFNRFPELVTKALSLPKGRSFGGGSLWLERA
jgi:hypothetical protein